jgi:hypothetical protein
MNDTGTLSSHTNSPGGTFLVILGATAHQIVAQFHRAQDSATLILSIFRGAAGDGPTDCRVHAQLLYNRA